LPETRRMGLQYGVDSLMICCSILTHYQIDVQIGGHFNNG